MRSWRTALGLLVVAGVLSGIGSGLTAFVVATEAFLRTRDATAVGWLTACGMGPLILMAPVGGMLADRYDRRLMMLIGDGGSGLLLGIVVWQLASPATSLVGIGAGVALSAAMAGLTEPALRATISDLVPAQHLDRASGLMQLSQALRWLVAPALAAVLLLVLPAAAVVALDIASFAATAAAAVAIRSVLGSRPAWSGSAGQELRTIVGVLRLDGVGSLIGLMAVAGAAMGIVETLLTPLVMGFASRTWLGVVTSLSASGMLLGAVLVSAVGVRLNLRTGLAVGLGGAGLALAVLSVRADLVLVTAAGVGFFLVLPLANASAEVLMRRGVPNQQLGRAWGAAGLISPLGTVAAKLAAGPLTDRLFAPAVAEGRLGLDRLLGTGPGRGAAAGILVAGLILVVTGVLVARSAALGRLAACDCEAASGSDQIE